MAAPALVHIIDRKNFEQSPTERGKAYTAKIRHNRELRERYGKGYKKFLNVPEKSIGGAIKMSF